MINKPTFSIAFQGRRDSMSVLMRRTWKAIDQPRWSLQVQDSQTMFQVRKHALWACLIFAMVSPVAVAAGQEADSQAESNEQTEAVDQALTQTQPVTILLVIGASGQPEYGQQFRQWADDWVTAADAAGAQLIQIGRESSETPDRDRLQKEIAGLDRNGPTPVWIVLIGHGTYAQNIAKFNLQDRDVSARELNQWLEPLKRTVVVVDCASASGPFVNRLSAPGRVIVTATKSGVEQNFARFGKYFAEAIASPNSDLDHDDEVSVHEAFLQASADVEQFYEIEARISTEHALIDDNGDGKGTPAKMFRGTRVIAAAKDGAEVDGKTAARVTLSLAKKRLPFTAEQLQQRDEIENQLDQLRARKSELAAEQYQAELETLFLRLAKIYQAAQQRAESQ